jgi:hypothetical protein
MSDTPESTDPLLPLMPRGVAAFAQSSWLRLLIVQAIFGLLAGGCIAIFFESSCEPAITDFVHSLPEHLWLNKGGIPAPPDTASGHTGFLSLSLSPEEHDSDLTSDIVFLFGQRTVQIGSLFGWSTFRYPVVEDMDIGRAGMMPRWGAWRPPIDAIIIIGTSCLLIVIWHLYAFPAAFLLRFLAFFGDRRLAKSGAWKLSCACLLPGSFLLSIGILLYAAHWLDLLRFLIWMGVHLIVGWIYFFVTPFWLPPVKGITGENPFASPAED